MTPPVPLVVTPLVAGATVATDPAGSVAGPTTSLVPTTRPQAVSTTPAAATAVPAPATTVSSTASIPASSHLQQGRWLQTIGDCDAARREFAAVVSASPGSAAVKPDELSEARFRLAECYLRDNAASDAAAALTELLDSAPAGDAYRAPAIFLLGEAQSAQRLWDDAVVNYTKYLALEPDLSSLIWQQIGSTRQTAGNLIGATEAYSQALTASPDWANTVAVRRALADVLSRRGDGSGAAAQYDLLRGEQTNGAWAAEMQYLAGSALKRSGDQSGAINRWQAAAAADPTSRYAYQAIVALIDANEPVDDFQRGVIDYHNAAYTPAVQALERVLASDPEGHSGEAWYYLGLSYLALDQYGQATVDLGNFIAAHSESSLWPDAWLAKARAQAGAGNSAGAVETYRQFAEARPDAAQAATALWQAANLEDENGDSSAAVQAYMALGQRYPASDVGWRAYLTAGLSYFRTGDYRQAGAVFTEMAENNRLPDWTRAVSYYWLGRAQEALGEAQAARLSWQKAVQAAPADFYGVRAAARLNGDGQVMFNGRASQLPAEADHAIDTGSLATWLHSWAGEGSLTLSTAIQEDPDFRRGQSLLTIGLRPAAITAWTRLEKRYESDPWALSALSLAFRDAGEYRLSIECAEMVAALAPAGTEIPVALGRLEYPLALAPLIKAQASKWNVDPLLVASVIRQESRFEAGATSSAVAQGLMQVIPDTAQWIATQLGWTQFTSSQIYLPYVNVEFGTYYLSQQLAAFDNSVVAALAGYNGGPGNAKVWRSRAPNDEDLMMALIDVSESRLYVQLVYQHYQAYRKYYPR